MCSFLASDDSSYMTGQVGPVQRLIGSGVFHPKDLPSFFCIHSGCEHVQPQASLLCRCCT